VIDFIEGLAPLPLAAVLVTAVEREGRLAGPNVKLIEEITARTTIPIQASGGVRDADDIRALADAGASAAIIGMALYTGALNPQTIIEKMSAWA
jgi:phosphoribosylformimino-5-aminoimidazole carboxamide ribonucleotide (ProFAR) isomerase